MSVTFTSSNKIFDTIGAVVVQQPNWQKNQTKLQQTKATAQNKEKNKPTK
jgi:hypothetical protein